MSPARKVLTGAMPIAVAVLVLVPDAAQACAVCFQGKSDASRVAFITTTAAMTFLPLAVIGGIAWWVRRQFVRAEVEASSRRDAGSSPELRSAAAGPVRSTTA